MDDCYHRDNIIGNTVHDAIRKVVRETPSHVKTFVAHAVNKGISRESIDGSNDLVSESLTQTSLVLLVPISSIRDVAQCLRADVDPVAH